MNAHELYQAGRLKDAVVSLMDVVKNNPTDYQSRGLLCELMIIQGELERADKQLDVIAHQSPEHATSVALYRQLIRALEARNDFFSQGRVPDVLAEPDSQLQTYLLASIALREGNNHEAWTIL